MSLSHLRNIFLYWHGLGIYSVKEMWSGYIFLVCRGVRGPSFSKKNLGFSVFRGQKYTSKYGNVRFFEMKNSNKIGENSG
jgi:hypothetical protein